MSDHTHNYKIISGNDPKVHAERCTGCNNVVRYNKREREKIDNKQYLKDHEADFAQPQGKTKDLFDKTYGK